MELNLSGNIIGVVSDDFKQDIFSGCVKDIVVNKPSSALKMVGLDDSYLDIAFDELSESEKNKVILASKLMDKTIVLVNFSKYLTNKDIEFYKKLFKKITSYDRKIVLVDKNSNMFINCVDKIYVINKNDIIYETDDIFDDNLNMYIDVPKIVEFINMCRSNGINLNHYCELDDLLKAIYRIRS